MAKIIKHAFLLVICGILLQCTDKREFKTGQIWATNLQGPDKEIEVLILSENYIHTAKGNRCVYVIQLSGVKDLSKDGNYLTLVYDSVLYKSCSILKQEKYALGNNKWTGFQSYVFQKVPNTVDIFAFDGDLEETLRMLRSNK